MVTGAAWPKEKLAPDPTAGAGADASAGFAEKLNDGVGPVDPEDAAVEVLVAEKEKELLPDVVEGSVDAFA